jgi:hypothetical protein
MAHLYGCWQEASILCGYRAAWAIPATWQLSSQEQGIRERTKVKPQCFYDVINYQTCCILFVTKFSTLAMGGLPGGRQEPLGDILEDSYHSFSKQITRLTPEILRRWRWWELWFLTSSQVMLIMLVLGPHFENHSFNFLEPHHWENFRNLVPRVCIDRYISKLVNTGISGRSQISHVSFIPIDYLLYYSKHNWNDYFYLCIVKLWRITKI